MQNVRDSGCPVIAQMMQVGSMDSTKNLRLAFSLPVRNQQELENLLREVSSPSSPNYRKYLSPEQFAERFGPTREDYRALIEFARANGFRITGRHPNRVILNVEASVPDVERAFHVKMGVYQHPTEARQFYAPDVEPSVEFGVRIMGVSGLNNYALPRPHFNIDGGTSKTGVSSNAGSGPIGTYAGNDFRAAYTPGTPLTGAGQTLGLVEFDGYHPADIAFYASRFGLRQIPLTNVLLDGFDGVPTIWGGQVEVCLDIQVAMAMAPGLANIIVYEAGPTGDWYTMLNRIATDNLAKQIGCSWYSPEAPADPVADQIFQQMAAQGQSFFVASGDSDAYTGLIPFPCDTPYVTLVGGSTLTTTGPGGAWVSETVWNWGGSIGGGGGISTQYKIPYWQQGINMSGNQGSLVMRNVPDVAMIADNVYVRADGIDRSVGGTSVAAPLWAAFTALVNQRAMTNGDAVGFLNPSLYALGLGPGYAAGFHDTTTGNNFRPESPTKFSAKVGYDLCTGLGTPTGESLINALAGPSDSLQISFPAFNPVGAPGGPFTPNSATYTLTNAGAVPVQWSVKTTQRWLTLSATGGTLAIAGTAEVIASLNTNANGLEQADYSSAILFGDVGTGVVQTRSIVLNVKPLPPIITSPSEAKGLLGTSFRYQITADNGATSYSTTGLPNGLRLNSSTGLISGSPGIAGSYPVILTASNAVGRGTSNLLLDISATPSATSQAATGISTMLATLRGTVNPNGFTTTVKFEYGTSSALVGALSTSGTVIGSGMDPVTMLDVVSGLSPSTKYYFRVTASSVGGNLAGKILSFTTSADPLIPIITPNPIQSVSDFGAALSARVNPKGAPTFVFFEYGLTTSYGSRTPAQDIGSGNTAIYAGFSLAGLVPGTLYHYRAVTVSGLGTFYGPDQTFTTQVEAGLFAVASKNDIAPGIPNACFTSFGNPALNDLGHSAFQAFVAAIPGTTASVNGANNSGIWAEIGLSQTGLVVRTGEPAPGIPNGIFATLSDPVFNNNDVIAFRGTVKPGPAGIVGANSVGIWTTSGSTLNLVTRARSQAPGCPAGALFSSFPQIVLPDQGGVVILGNLVASPGSGSAGGGVVGANNQGIWAVDTAGELKLILRKGDTQQINGTSKVISGISIFAISRFTGERSSYNSPGDLTFKVSFTDGSQTIEKAVFP